MSIKETVEGWLLNKFAGKIVARGAVTLAGLIANQIAAPKVQVLIAKAVVIAASLGLEISPKPVDEVAIAGAIIGAAHWAFEWFKKRRMANPASPAVQTDPKLAGTVAVPNT